jgi:cell division protein FtsL
MNWIQKNFRTLIYVAFLVPIITVAIVSISHVTKWYGISNPLSWSIYLSIGVEIAALSALAAIAAQMGKKVYFPFIIVTLIQFIGNIFFAYQYIDMNSQTFKDWVDMVDPVVQFLGVESGDLIGHKRFLALFAGGMLPIISLSFLHMLVKFEEEEKKKLPIQDLEIDIEKLSTEAGKLEAEVEKSKYTPSPEELEKLEEELRRLNEKKFGTLQEEQPLPEPIIVEEVKPSPIKKVLSYLRRDA